MLWKICSTHSRSSSVSCPKGEVIKVDNKVFFESCFVILWPAVVKIIQEKRLLCIAILLGIAFVRTTPAQEKAGCFPLGRRATRLSILDPWLSVPVSRQVWLCHPWNFHEANALGGFCWSIDGKSPDIIGHSYGTRNQTNRSCLGFLVTHW